MIRLLSGKYLRLPSVGKLSPEALISTSISMAAEVSCVSWSLPDIVCLYCAISVIPW